MSDTISGEVIPQPNGLFDLVWRLHVNGSHLGTIIDVEHRLSLDVAVGKQMRGRTYA